MAVLTRSRCGRLGSGCRRSWSSGGAWPRHSEVQSALALMRAMAKRGASAPALVQATASEVCLTPTLHANHGIARCSQHWRSCRPIDDTTFDTNERRQQR
eukprot:7498877-Heterocapsa_arctica.AAC.1